MSKINKVFTSGEKLTASDLNSIVSAHNALEDNSISNTILSNQSYVTQTSLDSNSYAGYSYVYAAYNYILNQIGNIETILQSI